jgi:hypothetical protein
VGEAEGEARGPRQREPEQDRHLRTQPRREHPAGRTLASSGDAAYGPFWWTGLAQSSVSG